MRTYIVINIVIATFVGDLCQPGLLGAKGLVQIKQFKLKKNKLWFHWLGSLGIYLDSKAKLFQASNLFHKPIPSLTNFVNKKVDSAPPGLEVQEKG